MYRNVKDRAFANSMAGWSLFVRGMHSNPSNSKRRLLWCDRSFSRRQQVYIAVKCTPAVKSNPLQVISTRCRLDLGMRNLIC